MTTKFPARILIAVITGFFAACAVAPPTADEIALMKAAPRPSGQEAASRAVKEYFAESLFDAESARYQFPLRPVQGSLRGSKGREFGWFMCGKINAKNRMGGYTGYKTFFVYFSPTIPDKIVDGTIADVDESGIVDEWCKGLYG